LIASIVTFDFWETTGSCTISSAVFTFVGLWGVVPVLL
jgi:hypothetical protein